MISFGEWLSRRRKSMGFTQQQLAEQLNCATITLRKIEAEQRRPSAQIAERLSQMLDIPPSEKLAFIRFARGYWQSPLSTRTGYLPWDHPVISLEHQSPIPTTAFIGRENELGALTTIVLDEKTRLITLIGPPGIGKSRLCYETTHLLHQDFPDGVIFVNLASLEDPNLLAPAVAQSAQFDATASKSPIEAVIAGFSNKRILLVLDNIENLVGDAAALVFDVLQSCPQLKIMATSREAMQIAGEQVFSVPALDFPTEMHLLSMDFEALTQFSSIRLFAERARLVNPSFSIDADNVNEIATICAQLDGLPLAIELFAGLIHMMTPDTLRSHMSSQFVLHTSRLHPLPAHHKTLHHAIDRSYATLSSEERQFFSSLSVFNGSFTLETVEQAFSSAIPASSITDLMASLVDKSLLQHTLDVRGEPHFYMLNLIQQFAAEHLQEFNQQTIVSGEYPFYFLRDASAIHEEIHRLEQSGVINTHHNI
jgi:predicted ATPase/transcriptional regulator with XRE-family HTH domain